MIENDFVEAIIALPENMFYNTGIATYIWFLSNKKEERRKGKIQLIDATGIKAQLRKNQGQKNCELTKELRDEIVRLFLDMKENEQSKIFDNSSFGYWQVTVLQPLIGRDGNPEKDKKGRLVPDKEKTDTENVPFDYEGGIDAFLKNEVHPFAPLAWIDKKKTKVGYEISFTKYFYSPKEFRPLVQITSEIDRLDNVRDQRSALISDLVTKGLGTNVPMKYSGISWLGDIPAHWKTVKLRQLLHPVSEKNHPELPLLSVVREQGVIIRDVDDIEGNHNFIPDDLSNYKVVRKGQFAMNKMKAWQGSYGVSQYTGIVSPAYFVFDVSFDNLEFFHYAIRSKVYVNFFAQASDGIRVGQWDLSIPKMKEIPFIVPPKEEEDAIVNFIPKISEKYDTEISELQTRIDLLLEQKNKMVSEIMTGRFQVPILQED